MPPELQHRIDSWHAQLPDDLKTQMQQMQQMHESMGSMHAGAGIETCFETPGETPSAGES
jgi:hypothetical protein